MGMGMWKDGIIGGEGGKDEMSRYGLLLHGNYRLSRESRVVRGSGLLLVAFGCKIFFTNSHPFSASSIEEQMVGIDGLQDLARLSASGG